MLTELNYDENENHDSIEEEMQVLLLTSNQKNYMSIYLKII